VPIAKAIFAALTAFALLGGPAGAVEQPDDVPFSRSVLDPTLVESPEVRPGAESCRAGVSRRLCDEERRVSRYMRAQVRCRAMQSRALRAGRAPMCRVMRCDHCEPNDRATRKPT
jgi:hypothetical protein